MTFRQQIAKYVTGNMTTDQLPNLVGTSGLEEGLDSPSLCILAGLSKNESPHQIEFYFKQTLQELNIELPNRRQAAIDYALGIVDDILLGKKDVILGTKEMCHNALDSYDFISETKKYVYDSISFETVYGLFVTHEELIQADRLWQTEKTNEQLMVETKTDLFEELKKWKNKMVSGT
ncbi:MAG: hypothetical protein KBF92_05745 [Bacteroidia bacterium]|nr:hypothetical protein [Bacteroidota bacterium]MBP9789185.1 hypothetical protein [Bacteroidia bacterium]MBP9923311.1 hypothetical protein [Bacteroidia bacterium]